ncbi:MAG TPA: shikimate dehydrogenase [Methylocella sp.]|nr:shikimate dehydrogenase [Methylocella sp.]
MTSVRKACVIGWPVAHSRSPLIHRFWLNTYNIPGEYELAPVSAADFPRFVGNLAGLGFVGANVTLPHKQRACELSQARAPAAERLKAANTLWIEEGKLYCDNTDCAGFLGGMDEDAPGWDCGGGPAVVIGAGGAARAIVLALQSRGVTPIFLANRTRARAEALVHDAGKPAEVLDFGKLAATLATAGLLVNTTSLGMAGQPTLDINLKPLPPQAIVCDIVYVPLETELIRAAKARDLRTVSGVGMLLHQAVPGFERWFGVRPEVTADLRTLVEADIKARAKC